MIPSGFGLDGWKSKKLVTKNITLEAMTLLSTLCGTHQAHYKLKAEKYQYQKSLKSLEDELWTSFRENTPFGGLIIDMETAFSAYVKQVTSSMPGIEVCSNIKIRPDLSQTKFTQAMLSG